MRTHALLGRAKQVRCHQPLVPIHMGALVQGADADGKLLAAVLAVIPALTHRALGGQSLDRIHLADEGAERAIGPALRFKVFAGLVLVVAVGVWNVGHWLSPSP